jgi:ribonuclease HI
MVIYCDGGSRGNPGPAASAFVATEENKLVHSEGKYLGHETNNCAEYRAVLMAINWLYKSGCTKDVIFNLDSQLVERQINGFYKVKNTKLKILFDEIIDKKKKLNCKIKFIWNYRSDNKLADSLVNETLDLQRENVK